MGGAVPPLPHTPSWRGAQLGGAEGQLYISDFKVECYLRDIIVAWLPKSLNLILKLSAKY
jgi:hypothetical protein